MSGHGVAAGNVFCLTLTTQLTPVSGTALPAGNSFPIAILDRRPPRSQSLTSSFLRVLGVLLFQDQLTAAHRENREALDLCFLSYLLLGLSSVLNREIYAHLDPEGGRRH